MGKTSKTGQLRIIGGNWRSRKIPFAAFAGVRPTPDRIRETLFNWLQQAIPGGRCLDLFAGSGALGFEALSRGAHEVCMVDQDLRVIQQLQENIDTLKTDKGHIVWSDSLEYLAGTPSPYDIVFLDPPFRDDIISECCQRLEKGWLNTTAWIYMESANSPDKKGLTLPDNWEIIRDKTAGQVHYQLAKREINA